MPFPVAATIGAAAVLGSGAMTAASSGKLNKKNRDWQEKMRDQNNEKSVEFWNMQNDYNETWWNKQNEYNEGMWNKQNQYMEDLWHRYQSPEAQMKYLKEAGLNPNLIYGQMGGGVPQTSTMQTDPMKPGHAPDAAGVGTPYTKYPDLSFMGDAVSTFNSMREQAARTNNLEEMNKVYQQQYENLKIDAAQKAMDVANSEYRNKGTFIDTTLKESLMGNSLDMAAESLRKMKQENYLSLRADERATVASATSLKEANMRMEMMRGQKLEQTYKNELLKMDAEMKRLGIQPSDNMLFRVLGRLWQEANTDKGIKDPFGNTWKWRLR